MADIDKSLPNVETEIKTPSDEEVAISEQETVFDILTMEKKG